MVAAVGTSVGMNLLAAGPGWKNLAVWVMPPVAYALASDTAIGVVRSWTLARHQHLRHALADDGSSPLAIVGGLLLWLLRLVLAPVSTLAGFRAWVLAECPVAPGRRAITSGTRPGTSAGTAESASGRREASAPRPRPARKPRPGKPGGGTKTAAFLALVEDRHGPLARFPLAGVSRAASDLAPQVGLHPGAARAALRRRVLALQNPDERAPVSRDRAGDPAAQAESVALDSGPAGDGGAR